MVRGSTKGRGPVGPVGAHYSYGEGEPAELSTKGPVGTHYSYGEGEGAFLDLVTSAESLDLVTSAESMAALCREFVTSPYRASPLWGR